METEQRILDELRQLRQLVVELSRQVADLSRDMMAVRIKMPGHPGCIPQDDWEGIQTG